MRPPPSSNSPTSSRRGTRSSSLAHPDDEVLGLRPLADALARGHGRACHRWRARKTATTPGFTGSGIRQAYAAARWAEARRALDLAGVPASRHHGFGIADQGAAYRLLDIARQLLPFVADADLVFTHAYEGGHPDHDAVAFAVAAAVRIAGRAGDTPIVEMPFYHAGPEGWIRQSFLPHGGTPDEIVIDLAPEDLALKQRMADCHRSQGDTLAGFRLDRERFRLAPPS